LRVLASEEILEDDDASLQAAADAISTPMIISINTKSPDAKL
jgi:hypothetical protein